MTLIIGSLVLNMAFIFLALKLLDDRRDLRIENKVLVDENIHLRLENKNYYKRYMEEISFQDGT